MSLLASRLFSFTLLIHVTIYNVDAPLAGPGLYQCPLTHASALTACATSDAARSIFSLAFFTR